LTSTNGISDSYNISIDIPQVIPTTTTTTSSTFTPTASSSPFPIFWIITYVGSGTLIGLAIILIICTLVTTAICHWHIYHRKGLYAVKGSLRSHNVELFQDHNDNVELSQNRTRSQPISIIDRKSDMQSTYGISESSASTFSKTDEQSNSSISKSQMLKHHPTSLNTDTRKKQHQSPNSMPNKTGSTWSFSFSSKNKHAVASHTKKQQKKKDNSKLNMLQAVVADEETRELMDVSSTTASEETARENKESQVDIPEELDSSSVPYQRQYTLPGIPFTGAKSAPINEPENVYVISVNPEECLRASMND
jgi:hypothetical protein